MTFHFFFLPLFSGTNPTDIGKTSFSCFLITFSLFAIILHIANKDLEVYNLGLRRNLKLSANYRRVSGYIKPDVWHFVVMTPSPISVRMVLYEENSVFWLALYHIGLCHIHSHLSVSELFFPSLWPPECKALGCLCEWVLTYA